MKALSFWAVIFVVLYTAPLKSQSPEFEAATVKPTRLVNAGVKSACHGIDSKFAPRDLAATVPLGRCVISSGRLSHMIGVAYNVTMDILQAGPGWVIDGQDRFDLEAKAENPATAREADLLSMLQNLLVDRFKLKFHWETREIDGFQLLVAPGGPKFHEAKPDEEEQLSAGFLALAYINRLIFNSGKDSNVPQLPVTSSFQKVSMARFAQLLLPAAGRHVEDRTNLKGFYDFTIVAQPGEAISGPLEKQLGLKLERRKIAIKFFIVDSAEKPAAN